MVDERRGHRHQWAAREHVVLGTSAQSPTRTRSQSAHVVRWGGELVLFDVGEGTQRQMLHAGISVAQLTRICITHAHGDHCLGLAGVLQRRSLDPDPAPIDVHVPASMVPNVHAMLASTVWDPENLDVRIHGTHDGDTVTLAGDTTLVARSLDHTVDTLGWRLQLGASRHFEPELLAHHGIVGADIARLQSHGVTHARDGTVVSVEDVSRVEPGAVFAYVMDTRPCDNAVTLAQGADLAVIESTYLRSEDRLAAAHGHCTAHDAATIAAHARVSRLILSHYSERYGSERAFAAEATAVHPDAHAAHDFDVIRPTTP